MNRLGDLYRDPVIHPYAKQISETVYTRHHHIFTTNKKGIHLSRALEKLPDIKASAIDTDRPHICIGRSADVDTAQKASLYDALCELKPWRKGPFNIFGIPIESEWDSSIKWDRLSPHLGSLKGKRVLDIGSSNGYYMFRMASRHPAWVLGIEPYLNFYFQYLAMSRYIVIPSIHCVPIRLEEMPAMRRCLDVVLCMGILYHRRSPLDTLLQLHRLMVPGGMMVLETLILEGEGDLALCPTHRYAKMKNIFFIPTIACLTQWLKRTGFDNIRCVDVSRTTFKEQRKTDWIDTESLGDFLDPEDPGKTIEGYPAPVRAMLIANARPK
jgi:tRNA (mo5U34)-methyltransferase